MPSGFKRKNGVGKYALRCAAKEKVSEDTAFRKKLGYGVPLSVWMRQQKYRDKIEGVLFGENSRKFFDVKILKDYWLNYLDGDCNEYRIVYAAYVFLIWYEQVFL